MSDKEQLIKEEIERLYNLYELSNDYQRMGACSTILDFIDSLPEEPASEDLEEDWSFEKILQEIYIKYDKKISIESLLDIASHFAEWQKQQMMKDAVEGTVKYEIGSAEIPQCDRRYQVLSDPAPIANAKLGEKVKEDGKNQKTVLKPEEIEKIVNTFNNSDVDLSHIFNFKYSNLFSPGIPPQISAYCRRTF